MATYLYRHKIKILIITCFIIGAVVGDFIDFSRLYYGYDKHRYDELLNLYFKNEKEALDIIDNINTENSEFNVSELSNGKQLWLDNTNIIDDICHIRNIPYDIKLATSKLRQYCVLRLHYFSILQKKLNGSSVKKYDMELKKLEDKINKYVQENKLDTTKS